MSLTMRTTAIIALALCGISGVAGGQAAVTWQGTAKNALYWELLGNGFGMSLNYDRKLNQNFTARLGYGAFDDLAFAYVDSPRNYRTYVGMINALAGGPLWWFETGLGGMAGVSRTDRPHSELPLAHVTSTFGFRRQPAQGGAVIRFGFTPRYVIYGERSSWGGRLGMRAAFSIGFAF